MTLELIDSYCECVQQLPPPDHRHYDKYMLCTECGTRYAYSMLHQRWESINKATTAHYSLHSLSERMQGTTIELLVDVRRILSDILTELKVNDKLRLEVELRQLLKSLSSDG